MGLHFYKPNKGNTGGAAGWTFKSKHDDQGIFVKVMKQNGWNEQTGNGIFKDGKETNLKFSLFEIGTIINCIQRRVPAKFYHAVEKEGVKTSTSIEFKPYKGKVKGADGKWVDGSEISGFSLIANKADETYQISFSFGEAITLQKWLEFALEHCFSALYSQDKKRAEEYLKKKKENEGAPKSPQDFVKTEPEAETKAENGADDDWF